MEPKFNQLLNLLNGELGVYADQCVQVDNIWSRLIGGPTLTGNAIDLKQNAGDFYEWIDNTPDNFPSQGDMPVFGRPYGLLPDGTYAGHTGVSSNNSNKNTMEILEQNDPNKSSVHLHTYGYTGCLGWLHPKAIQGGEQNPPTLTDQSKFDFGSVVLSENSGGQKIEYGILEMQRVRSMLIAKDKKIIEYLQITGDQNTEILNLQDDKTGLNVKIINLQKELTDCQGHPAVDIPTYLKTLNFWERLKLVFS